MSLTDETTAPLRHADRFFIGGEWVVPSSDSKIDVIDSDTEQVFFSVAEAQAADISRAVGAARQAGLPAVLLTFEPHPAEVVRPQDAPLRLTTPSASSMVATTTTLEWPRAK